MSGATSARWWRRSRASPAPSRWRCGASSPTACCSTSPPRSTSSRSPPRASGRPRGPCPPRSPGTARQDDRCHDPHGSDHPVLDRLARFLDRRRRLVLLASILVVFAAGAYGGKVVTLLDV